MRYARTLLFVLLLVPLCGFSAYCQSDVDASRRNAIVRAIEKASPGVVSVNVVELEAQRVLEPVAEDFWQMFHFFRPRYKIGRRQVDSVGSGFIFDKEGHILTNYHVLEGAESVASVTLADGRNIEVEFVGKDERTDIAVLRAKTKGLPYVELGNSDDLLTGEWVIAIGNPFGMLMMDAQPTVSVGVVSANHRQISPSIGGGERLYQDMIQTDAAINPGNSGGPLVNANGVVVGINTMIFTESGGSIGLGFAIPIDRVQRVVREILQYGRRRDPWPGFNAESVSMIRANILRDMGISAESGCLVVNIMKRSPAHAAGLRAGDVITGVKISEKTKKFQPVRQPTDIDFAVWSTFVGDTLTLEIDRKGKQETVSFEIKELDR